jgi:hypothetical protein
LRQVHRRWLMAGRCSVISGAVRRGEKGDKGERGTDAPTITNWHVDSERYSITPFFSNGQMGPALELRQGHRNVRGGAYLMGQRLLRAVTPSGSAATRRAKPRPICL